jgi:hypothetical protein
MVATGWFGSCSLDPLTRPALAEESADAGHPLP